MEQRNFPRLKLKEQSCVIHDGTQYKPTGEGERETFCLILDMGYGGVSIKTNISSAVGASMVIGFPKISDLESFTVGCEVRRVEMAENINGVAYAHIYRMGLRFLNPDVNKIKAGLSILVVLNA